MIGKARAVHHRWSGDRIVTFPLRKEDLEAEHAHPRRTSFDKWPGDKSSDFDRVLRHAGLIRGQNSKRASPGVHGKNLLKLSEERY